jgi:SH3-like domain-containing protein
MRPQFAAFLLGLAVAASAAAPSLAFEDDAAFPYKAYVTTNDVHVRSGPGANYYATDVLKEGQPVEVYRQEPGGWCAIRPPEGSFSWISVHFVKPTHDHLGVVTEEGAAARIGSKFRDIRDVSYVHLHKGEVVEILEAPHGAGGGGANNWYKITPPAGEFRWAPSKFLDRDDPRTSAKRRHRGPAAEESLSSRSGRPPEFSPEEFKEELERIDLDLSMMIAEPMSSWRFGTLEERSHRMVDRAQTAIERGRARILADKIARFDDLKQRQDALDALRDRTDRNTRLYGASDRYAYRGMSRETRLEREGRYDAVGRLTEVKPAKPGAPRYALIDDNGAIRSYITSSPGIRLETYLGREIGVTGTRAYLIEQHAEHVLARQVTPIDGNMLR